MLEIGSLGSVRRALLFYDGALTRQNIILAKMDAILTTIFQESNNTMASLTINIELENFVNGVMGKKHIDSTPVWMN